MNKTLFSQLILCFFKAFSKKFAYVYSYAKTCQVHMLFKDALCHLIEYKNTAKTVQNFAKIL